MFKPKDLTLIALMTTLLIALGFVPAIPLGFIPVPVVLQNLGVMLIGLLLGAKRGSMAMLLFFLAGLVLPVFSAKATTLAVLAGPTAGYVLAWFFVPALMGLFFSFVKKQSFGWVFFGVFLVGVLFVDVLGAIWLSHATKMTLDKSLLSNLAFIPGDTIKAICATVVFLRLPNIRK